MSQSIISALPIGVYDSGVGGVTVLKVLSQMLPDENFIYFADTAHLPYGDKTPEQIKTYTKDIINWFQTIGKTKMIVAACHTSSAIGLPALSLANTPILGIVTPLLNVLKRADNIGILSTPATAKSAIHEKILRQNGFSGKIMMISCPEFVPLIEQGIKTGQMDDARLIWHAKEYLKPFYEHDLNTLVYGCTHYPFISNLIESLLPKHVKHINPAQSLAVEVMKQLDQQNLRNHSGVKRPVHFELSAGQSNADLYKLLHETLMANEGKVEKPNACGG